MTGSTATRDDATHSDPTPNTGWWGTAFIVLLLLGAGMFSAPTAADPLPAVRSVYQHHPVVVRMSQLVGLSAAAALLSTCATLEAPGIATTLRWMFAASPALSPR